MLILIFFAFVGGVVTILSPCILPILPIILSGSVGEGKRKPYGIVSGFILSFTFFTLFLTSIVNATGISADTLRYISVVILALFGLTLIIPQIQGKIEQMFSKLSSRAPQQGERHGFGGGFIIGLSLGLLWTPCVGPILASVISLALTGSVNGSAFIITLAYALGTALPMLAIMYGGRKLLNRVPWLLTKGALIQKVFGVIMILVAMMIYFNLDRQFQSYILQKFPNYGTVLTGLEDNDLIRQELDDMSQEDNNNQNYMLAPEFIPGGQWLNSEPLTLEGLRGKVVLFDFMTYSCINCIRTFPYLNAWYDSYQDDGLVVIGIHTPEFEFEKNVDNVAQALKDFEIEFPVMQDNDYATWKAYGNRYWPHTYLIDHNGQIVYDHIGEGNYEETEAKIKELLAARIKDLSEDNQIEERESDISSETTQSKSPETYFGSARNSLLANGQAFTSGIFQFDRPDDIELNKLYLVGKWNITSEYAQALSSDASIIFSYDAKKIFMVAGADQAVSLDIIEDGTLISSDINIQAETLYTLSSHDKRSRHTIEIKPRSSGLKAFTFTFG